MHVRKKMLFVITKNWAENKYQIMNGMDIAYSWIVYTSLEYLCDFWLFLLQVWENFWVPRYPVSHLRGTMAGSVISDDPIFLYIALRPRHPGPGMQDLERRFIPTSFLDWCHACPALQRTQSEFRRSILHFRAKKKSKDVFVSFLFNVLENKGT